MFDATQLFKDRLGEHLKLLNRYLRYIFNGHFMIALLFIIITISVYYQQWLEQLSPNFPAVMVLALLFGFVVSYNPIQSFLKEPDKVFLIVKEAEMQAYFKRSLVYNFIFQLYIVIIVTAALAPMFMQVFPHKTTKDYLLVILILLLLKGLNMTTNWYMFKIQHTTIRRLDKVIRAMLSIAIFYLLLNDSTFVIVIIVFYFALMINNYFLIKKQPGLAWEMLIQNDQHRLASFYRFVSMFANVPHLSNRLKKRPLLSKFVNFRVPFLHRSTFAYLYRLSFIRSSDYLSLYIRLTVIGSIAIYFVPNGWLKLAFLLLFLYMTSFQMISLYHHYRTNIWIDLYPIENIVRRKTFLTFLSHITIGQAIIFSLVFIGLTQYIYFLYGLIIGLVFTYIFIHLYVKQKLNK